MVQKIKKVKKLCECKQCGNEAEMVITCTLNELETASDPPASETHKEGQSHRVKGSATCTHCGNEADMWVDLE